MEVPFALWRHAAANSLLKRAYCVSFELTHNCNARCRHCHRGDPVPNEALATPARLLDICRELHPVVAVMSGGEPLMRRDAVEIVRTLKQGCRPMRIFFNTNTGLLTEARFEELRDAGVDEFLLSFDYPDGRHDDFRGIPGLFERIAGLVGSRTREDRKRVVLTTVLQHDNFREAPAMARLALDWGVNINFSAYTWLRTHDKSLMIQPEELDEFRQVVERLCAFKREHRTILTSEYVMRKMVEFFQQGSIDNCRAGERMLVVNPDGTLSPCGLLVRNYKTRAELIREHTRKNTCTFCYTSSRANSERPVATLLVDNLNREVSRFAWLPTGRRAPAEVPEQPGRS